MGQADARDRYPRGFRAHRGLEGSEARHGPRHAFVLMAAGPGRHRGRCRGDRQSQVPRRRKLVHPLLPLARDLRAVDRSLPAKPRFGSTAARRAPAAAALRRLQVVGAGRLGSCDRCQRQQAAAAWRAVRQRVCHHGAGEPPGGPGGVDRASAGKGEGRHAQSRLTAAAMRASSARSGPRGCGGARRVSGACRSRRSPTACQPKNRLTRSRITPAWCWISSAVGPSTRSSSVPGSGMSSPNGRGHWIFSGSEWAAMSAPTISAQRVTSSFEAKPCLAKASLSVLRRRSESGRGCDLRGLSIVVRSVPSDAMTVAIRSRGKKATAASADELLAWYDRHRRALPWRAPPGEPVDPYRVWLSEIMLQQTTVRAVAPYFARFLERWPDVKTLAHASLDEVLGAWAGLGYYSRARNLHRTAQIIAKEFSGRFPE